MSKSISSLVAIVTISSSASAHTGDHSSFQILEAISHLLSSPLHSGVLIGAVTVTALAFIGTTRRQR